MKSILSGFLILVSLSSVSHANLSMDSILHSGNWCEGMEIQAGKNNTALVVRPQELNLTADGSRVHFYCNLALTFNVPAGYSLTIKSFAKSTDATISGAESTWNTRRAIFVRERMILGENLTYKNTNLRSFSSEKRSLGSYKFGCGESPLLRIELSETLSGFGDLKVNTQAGNSDVELITEVSPCSAENK